MIKAPSEFQDDRAKIGVIWKLSNLLLFLPKITNFYFKHTETHGMTLMEQPKNFEELRGKIRADMGVF